VLKCISSRLYAAYFCVLLSFQYQIDLNMSGCHVSFTNFHICYTGMCIVVMSTLFISFGRVITLRCIQSRVRFGYLSIVIHYLPISTNPQIPTDILTLDFLILLVRKKSLVHKYSPLLALVSGLGHTSWYVGLGHTSASQFLPGFLRLLHLKSPIDLNLSVCYVSFTYFHVFYRSTMCMCIVAISIQLRLSHNPQIYLILG
jgi:hypothetical protein